MGAGTGKLNAGNAWVQIIPIGIELLNQPDFPRPIPLLQLLLASDRVFGIIELFEIDEPVDFVFLCKAFDRFQSMFGYSTNEVIGHAGILVRTVKPGDDE
jgi:hypothetical protein